MNHLNEQQIAELLSASPNELGQVPGLTEAQAHAETCPDCAAELSSMRESLALFREASTAYADARMHHVPAFQPPMRRPFYQPALWAAAAAVLLLATFVPTQLRRPVPPIQQVPVNTTQQMPPESDEALLESVNREVSASVPTPMAALADPAGSGTQASQNSTQRTN